MRILLDTQCWLWMNASPERFRPVTRDLIETDATELLFSAASAWEIAVKYALKKLQLPMSPGDYVESRLRQTRATPLPISCNHALWAGELPPRHRDPFDRLLVAQAQLENVPILTADRTFQLYDVDVLDA
jgi:PIN domain nuclease of toxin-antitoxin system